MLHKTTRYPFRALRKIQIIIYRLRYNDIKELWLVINSNIFLYWVKVNTKVTSWFELGLDGAYSRRDYSGIAANVGTAELMSPYGVMYRDSLGHLEKYPYTQSPIILYGV